MLTFLMNDAILFNMDIDLQKPCFKCGIIQPLANFYAHPQMSDGHVNKCKVCSKKDVQANYRKNREHFLEYDKRRNQLPERREAQRIHRRASYLRHAKTKIIKQRVSRRLHPDKYQARMQLGNAIKNGHLKRLPCEKCGDENSHGHHEDYSKPLEVMWLCALHHAARHKELRSLGINL